MINTKTNKKNNIRQAVPHAPSTGGQALLLLIMVLAVVSTIAATAAFQSTQTTKTAKAAQESKTAFAAAEGILNQVLNGATPDQSFFSNLNNAVVPVITQTQASQSLVTQIEKDNSVTIYTADYNPQTNAFGPSYANLTLKIYYSLINSNSDTTDCPVLEIIKISKANGTTRQLTGSCNGNNITGNGLAPSALIGGVTIGGSTFYRSTSVAVAANELVIVRALMSGTTIGINQTLPPQGTQISATARTQGGAQKTVRVLRSYPQIPVEMVTTRL